MTKRNQWPLSPFSKQGSIEPVIYAIAGWVREINFACDQLVKEHADREEVDPAILREAAELLKVEVARRYVEDMELRG